MSNLTFADAEAATRPITVLTPETLDDWRSEAGPIANGWIETNNFTAGFGQVLVLPDQNGAPEMALVGAGSERDRRRKRFALAAARMKLPPYQWHITNPKDVPSLKNELLGWLFAGYGFEAYKSSNSGDMADLVVPDGVDGARLEAIAAGEALTRDLINTPANDMGPFELEGAARTIANEFGAKFAVISGDELKKDYPLIHAVGSASDRPPRLIDMACGETGPKIALVGKGVCFDTGGLNLKPGASMGLMKKDMGGAATVLGLARMIMALKLPIRLRVLVPAVENSVSGAAFRPGDILRSRKGLTVEINNTDAEGRLVLADALAKASEESPDLIVSMATLTGAARVAVGADLAPFYTDDDELGSELSAAADEVADPVWRLPFWDPYESLIEPGIADLDNAPKGGFAGSITAALFLRRFVGEGDRYVHFDIYGWQPSAAPGRPKGGVGQGGRALLETLSRLPEQ